MLRRARPGGAPVGLKGYSRVLHVAGEQGMASTWADAPLELRVTILPAASAADPTVLPWDYPSTPSRFSTPSPLFSALLTLAVNVHVFATVHRCICTYVHTLSFGL